MINDIIAIIAENYKKFFVKNQKVFWIINELKKRLFEHYHDRMKIFNFKAINELSFYRKIDHNINLQLEIIFSTKKIYELFREQALIIKTYIDDMRQKEFIRHNFSFYAASIFIVKKSNENLRICVNYRVFNNVIIKNCNALFLLKNTFARLCQVKIYNKFDIIAVFNEVRMKLDHEKKIVFIIRYEFFKYVVMLFDLCNVFETFQTLINKMLQEYLNDFCAIYLNDIFVYSNLKAKYIEHVNKMLFKLKKANLYLNIDKCEFHVITIKYLNFIIIIKDIQMNFDKIKIILR